MRQYLHLLPDDPESPLLPSFPKGRNSGLPVSYAGARKAFREALSRSGICPDGFGLHSGRVGGNVAMQEAELSLEVRNRKARFAAGSAVAEHYARLAPRKSEAAKTSAVLSLDLPL